MIEAAALGKPISELRYIIGKPVLVPARPPEGDPDFGATRYLKYAKHGFAVLLGWDDIIEGVQFFGAENDDGMSAYTGALLAGLSFESTRSEVRAALGQPQESNEASKLGPAGFAIRPWDWFEHEGRKLHFEYRDAGDGVRLISLLRLPRLRDSL